jgi:hypothetical protein
MVTYAAKRAAIWTWNAEVTKDGKPFATAKFPTFLRECSGTITIGKRTLTIDRPDGWLSGEWRLCDASGAEVAKIKKPSAIFRAFEVTAGGERWHLKQVWPCRRKMVVTKGAKADGYGAKQVGTLRPRGTFRCTTEAVFTDEMPEEAQILCVWIMYLMQRRTIANVGGGAGGN